MKSLLPVFLATFLFASCSEFQYITLSGINSTPTKAEELVFENDTVRVIYRFTYDGGKTGITLYNKTAEPLEIDWRRSALIVGDRAYSYHNPAAAFAGQVDTSISGRSPNLTSSFNGVISIQEVSQFLPPRSTVQRTTFELPVRRLNYLEADAQKATVNHLGLATKYKRVAFNQGGSPVNIRSYLSLRIGAASAGREFSVEHRFYVSEIWSTGSGPGDFPDETFSRGNRIPARW